MKIVFDLYHWHHPDACAVLHRDFDTMNAAMNAVPAIEHEQYPRQRVTDHAAATQVQNWRALPRESDERGWLLDEAQTGGVRVWGIFERQVGETDAERIELAVDVAHEYAQIDGDHHKTWVIDQMMRNLLGDRYEAWVTEYCDGVDGPETYSWDEGIAP